MATGVYGKRKNLSIFRNTGVKSQSQRQALRHRQNASQLSLCRVNYLVPEAKIVHVKRYIARDLLVEL